MAELADRLDVDERTVRRYVDHLIDLDVPVESELPSAGGADPETEHWLRVELHAERLDWLPRCSRRSTGRSSSSDRTNSATSSRPSPTGS